MTAPTTRVLHDDPLKDGQWWAYSEPERPAEESDTFYDTRCAACILKLEAEVVMRGNHRLKPFKKGPLMLASELIAHYREQS